MLLAVQMNTLADDELDGFAALIAIKEPIFDHGSPLPLAGGCVPTGQVRPMAATGYR